MKIAIRYFSRTNNTKKMADTVAKAVDVDALDVTHPLTEDVDILFLGSSVYAAGADNQVKNFIRDIDVNVGEVVNFSSAALIPSTYNQIKKLVEEKGLKMSSDEFHCRGKFTMMHRDRPNSDDLSELATFAKKVVNQSA